MRLTELVCPLKPLEAMATNTAVIGSDVGGIREYVKEGQTGLLFNAGDTDHLAERMSFLLENPEYRTELCKNGRDAVVNRWHWPAVVKKYHDIYEQAIESPRKGIKKMVG